jgi:hypothetical protein
MKLGLAGILVSLLLTACAFTVGHRAVTPGTETVVVAITGGLGPALPPGATCAPHDGSFVLHLTTHELAWDQCMDGTKRRGQRLLGPEEMATLRGALARLTVVPSRDSSCGTSVEYTPRVRVTAGGQEYDDDAKACKPDNPTLDHRALWDLREVLVGLAHP